MAEFNLKIIKTFFIVVIAMLILAMTSGMQILRGAKLLALEKIKMEANFLKYKRVLASEAAGEHSAEQNAESVPILLYHGIITGQEGAGDATNISLENFREHMFSLKKAGYQTITLQDLNDFIRNKKKIPKKSILITFDDGRRSSFVGADPIFRALGFKAVIFAITGHSAYKNNSADGDYYLSMNELKDMQSSGRWEIESHGDLAHDWQNISEDGQRGHFLSNRIWLPEENRMETVEEAKIRIKDDLVFAKDKLEKALGRPVRGFAYPFNDYGEESQNFPEVQEYIKRITAEIYPLAFLQVESDDAAGNYPDPAIFNMKRIDVANDLSTSNLLRILKQNEDKKLPFQDTFWEDEGWISRWGAKNIWGDLSLSDEENEKSGNMTILLGGKNWRNYTFKSQVIIHQGNSISQVVNYQDDDNLASCNFSFSGTIISEKRSGKEVVVFESPIPLSLAPEEEISFETKVNGNTITCLFNGKIAAKGQVYHDTGGGIGFSLWDELPERSQISIKKVEVAPIFQ